MKKILGLALAAFVLMALVAGGTWAYFSDTEVSGTNTITAGKLNLKVNNEAAFTITLNARKPGHNGNAATWLVNNDGDLNGDLSVTLSAITNNENTRLAMETAAGDGSDVGGELGSLLKMAFWMDVDKSGGWTSGDYYLKSDGSKVSHSGGGPALPSAAYDILDNYDLDAFANCQTGVAPGDLGNFRVEYDFPDAGNNTDNKAQTDDVQFTITFDLKAS